MSESKTNDGLMYYESKTNDYDLIYCESKTSNTNGVFCYFYNDNYIHLITIVPLENIKEDKK